MHGVIFGELKKFVDRTVGEDAWNRLLAQSGLEHKLYTPVKEYADDELLALVAGISRMTGAEVKPLLTDFGRFMIPHLLTLYRRQIQPDWTVMQLLKRVESTIHKVVRLRNPGASPPSLRVEPIDERRIVIHYSSPRRLCGLGIGLIEGLATAYGETLAIAERTCMLHGDAQCTIEIARDDAAEARHRGARLALPQAPLGQAPTPVPQRLPPRVAGGVPRYRGDPAPVGRALPQRRSVGEATRRGPRDEAPIVIVGTGLIGTCAAREILRRNPGTAVRLFGAEPWEPYNRVRLSELLAGEVDWSEIAAPLDVGSDDDVSLRVNQPVLAIDTAGKAVILSDGERQPYSYLILATGARARPADTQGRKLFGIYTYRDVDDAQELLTYVVQSASTVILGGGILGIEVAFALKRQNPATAVTLMHRRSHLMNRELDAATAGFLLEQAEKAGIAFRFNTTIAEYIGDTDLSAIVLSDGQRLPCDTLVVCTGIVPNIELARAAGLRTGQGIQVNRWMQTSDAAIYAIGDCAEYEGKTYGIVGPGMEQASVAVDNILNGNRREFRHSTTSTRVKIKGLPVLSLGRAHPIKDERAVGTLAWRDDDAVLYRQVRLYRGRLVGARAVGEWAEVSMVQAAIDRGARLWPWERRYFLRHGALSPDAGAADPARLPAGAAICTCAGVTRGALADAIAAGCSSVEDLSLQTAAGQYCGSCRPALARLVGAPASQETAGVPGAPFVALSLIAALVPFLALVLPGVPVSRSALQPDGWLAWLADDSVRQASGYGAVLLLLAGLGLSVNKRLKGLRFLSYNGWRTLHVALAAIAGAVLLVHTDLGAGAGLGRQMTVLFLVLTISGLALSAAAMLERGFFGSWIRRYRGWMLTLHGVTMTILFVCVPIHAVATYYY